MYLSVNSHHYSVLTHWNLAMHMCWWTRLKLVQKMVSQMFDAKSQPAPMLTYYQLHQWNWIQNTKISSKLIHLNMYEGVVCKMSTISFTPQWVNEEHWAALHIRADFRLATSQWETTLQSNAVSHWLGANLESALQIVHDLIIAYGAPL